MGMGWRWDPTEEETKVAYLTTYAYGPVDTDSSAPIEMQWRTHPSILLDFPEEMSDADRYFSCMERAAKAARLGLEKKALDQGGFSPAYDKYRVSLWKPGADKRACFIGFLTAYWFSDGMVGDTYTGMKHHPQLVKS